MSQYWHAVHVCVRARRVQAGCVCVCEYVLLCMCVHVYVCVCVQVEVGTEGNPRRIPVFAARSVAVRLVHR